MALDRSTSEYEISKLWTRSPAIADEFNEELRTNEALALSVERIWFKETELQSRVQAIQRELLACTEDLIASPKAQDDKFMSFDTADHIFHGYVGVDGHRITKSDFELRWPKGFPVPSTAKGPLYRGFTSKPWVLTQAQDAYNFVCLADEQLSRIITGTLSSQATESQILGELEIALDWAVRAWDLLSHPPAESFPSKVGQPPPGTLEPSPSEDVLIEVGLCGGELILKAHMLHIDWPAKVREGRPVQTGRVGIGRYDTSSSVLINGAWCKTHSYSEGAVLGVLASWEVHIVLPLISSAYSHLANALSEATALRDLLSSLSY